MIGRSKELEDVGRVASSFPTYLGKIEASLLAGYFLYSYCYRIDRLRPLVYIKSAFTKVLGLFVLYC